MMNAKERPKMNREDRAKQFMPFAALKGYEEAIRARQHVVVPKTDLSEERLNELDEIFKDLLKGDMVTVVYYSALEENYLKVTGMVSKIDPDSRIIKIVNTTINFDDIYELAKVCDKITPWQ